MRKPDLVIGVIIGACILFVFAVLLLAFLGTFATRPLAFSSLGKRVALVEIKGVIGGSESVVRQLKRYAEDESVPAIVLRIDSPGGAASASQAAGMPTSFILDHDMHGKLTSSSARAPTRSTRRWRRTKPRSSAGKAKAPR